MEITLDTRFFRYRTKEDEQLRENSILRRLKNIKKDDFTPELMSSERIESFDST